MAGKNRRETTLLAASRILRRRRQWRAGRRILAFVGILVFAAVLLGIQRNRGTILAQRTKPNSSAPVHFLTDADLMALFPNTAVGLAKLTDGREILIFPRPGDQARYITHL